MALKIYFLFALVSAHETALAGVAFGLSALCILIMSLAIVGDYNNNFKQLWKDVGSKWSRILSILIGICVFTYILTPGKEAAITIIAAEAVESGALAEAINGISEAVK